MAPQNTVGAAMPPRETPPALSGVIRDRIHSAFFHKSGERKSQRQDWQKLWSAIEYSPAAVLLTDVRGVISYINPKFCALTGYSAEDVRGRNVRMFKSGQMRPETYRDLWKMLLAGQEWRGEFHNKKKNGEAYWEFASIAPIKDAGGYPTHFISIKEDITARKKAEEERERIISELLEALANVKTLTGPLPVCSWCKKIRDYDGQWKKLAIAVPAHLGARFSHGICPNCAMDMLRSIPAGCRPCHEKPAPQPAFHNHSRRF